VNAYDWAALEHAYPGAWDARPFLAGLLDPDPAVRVAALNGLEPVRHQNTIYEATVPAILYIAGILPEAAALSVRPGRSDPGQGSRSRTITALLLDWIADVSRDADDTTVATLQRLGWEPHTPLQAIRALRPLLFRAVEPFLLDDDQVVREAALLAAIPMVEAAELETHRAGLIPLLHLLLAGSTNRMQRSRATDVCVAWGCGSHSGHQATKHGHDEPWTPGPGAGSRDDPPF
jgi:hypothetical protein